METRSQQLQMQNACRVDFDKIPDQLTDVHLRQLRRSSRRTNNKWPEQRETRDGGRSRPMSGGSRRSYGLRERYATTDNRKSKSFSRGSNMWTAQQENNLCSVGNVVYNTRSNNPWTYQRENGLCNVRDAVQNLSNVDDQSQQLQDEIDSLMNELLMPSSNNAVSNVVDCTVQNACKNANPNEFARTDSTIQEMLFNTFHNENMQITIQTGEGGRKRFIVEQMTHQIFSSEEPVTENGLHGISDTNSNPNAANNWSSCGVYSSSSVSGNNNVSNPLFQQHPFSPVLFQTDNNGYSGALQGNHKSYRRLQECMQVKEPQLRVFTNFGQEQDERQPLPLIPEIPPLYYDNRELPLVPQSQLVCYNNTTQPLMFEPPPLVSSKNKKPPSTSQLYCKNTTLALQPRLPPPMCYENTTHALMTQRPPVYYENTMQPLISPSSTMYSNNAIQSLVCRPPPTYNNNTTQALMSQPSPMYNNNTPQSLMCQPGPVYFNNNATQSITYQPPQMYSANTPHMVYDNSDDFSMNHTVDNIITNDSYW